jgi:hypothetical protein
VTDIQLINWTIEEAKFLKAEGPQPGDVDPIPSLISYSHGPKVISRDALLSRSIPSPRAPRSIRPPKRLLSSPRQRTRRLHPSREPHCIRR